MTGTVEAQVQTLIGHLLDKFRDVDSTARETAVRVL